VAIFLIVVGFAVNFVCGIMILIRAFKVSVGWGLAVLFLPFAGLLFVINHWNDTKMPFLGGLAGGLMILLGVIAAPTPERDVDDAVAERMASRASDAEDDEEEAAPQANYASAAAPAPYTPPRTAYQPATYTPAYNPPPAPAPAVTDTQPAEDEWTRGKPTLEQVYVDRATNQFYAEKCRKRPENAYRLPKSVALMQGMTEAACK
jgi:hypothetical protein